MDALKKLNKVAYIRFASVYRSFEDVREFGEGLPACKTKGSFMYHDRIFMARAFELARLGRLPPRSIRTSAALSCATRNCR